MEIIKLPIETLTPDPNNAKEHPDWQIEQIKNSIEQFGNNDPIAVWGEKNIIVEGHGRYEALKELGYTEAECIRLDSLTDEERKAYALAHNKLTMNTDFDFGALELTLDAIEDIDMSLFGFETATETVEVVEDDYDEDEDEKVPPKAKRGEIYQLGNHRLMCGDSSSPTDLASLMGGEKGKMVFTDPPYGVSIGDKNKMLNSIQRYGRILENIENDTLGKDELYDLLVKCFSNLRENCSEDCSYYVTSPQGGEIGLMMMMMRDSGLEVRHNLIWKKNAATFSMGRLDYDYQHEPIFYTWTKKHNFYGKGYQTTVWEFDKPRKCDLHPTMKPVPLIAHALKNSSREGDNVVDIFGGSGSTLIACEEMNRKCFMMELDPHYCDVIIKRWEDFTGQKAVLLSE